jgi:hypothetical protein
MKRFLITFLVFTTLFFITEKASWYFVNNAPNRESDRRLEAVLKGGFNKEILIIGSSRGANNVLACQLETETGLTTYNLSYIGTNLNFHEFILSSYLKFNKAPKQLLLFVDHKHTFKETKSLFFRYDVLFPFAKYEYINNKLIQDDKQSYASKVIALLRLKRNDFSIKKKKTAVNQWLTFCGSKPNTVKKKKEFEFIKTIETYESSSETQLLLKSFYNIQKLCKTNGIDLVIVNSPSFSTFNSGFNTRLNNLKWPENRSFIYDTLNPIYKNINYFNDPSHLFLNGAKVFTSEISTFLNTTKKK